MSLAGAAASILSAEAAEVEAISGLASRDELCAITICTGVAGTACVAVAATVVTSGLPLTVSTRKASRAPTARMTTMAAIETATTVEFVC